MSQDPESDFLSFVEEPAPHACYQNLAKSARSEQLKVARYLLLFVGLLTTAVNGYAFSQVDRFVDSQVQQQFNGQRVMDEVEEQAAVAQLRNRLTSLLYFMLGAAVVFGVVYMILGIIVYAYPLRATIGGLVLFVASMVLFGVLAPQTLWAGLLPKIVIIVALAASVRTAVAWRVSPKS
jgi:CBS domain containing-hemolysin-like protein